jgi:hypothetical protein
MFEQLSVDQVQVLEDDIFAAVSKLQVILNQTDLQELSKSLVSALSAKISSMADPLKKSYTEFLTQEFNTADPESVKKKDHLLREWRSTIKTMKLGLKSLTLSLANMISCQRTSKRTHDLQRLVRQTQIQGNVEAVKSMTFDTLAGYLETYAGDMGVMLLNIETTSYRQLLRNLKNKTIDARYAQTPLNILEKRRNESFV